MCRGWAGLKVVRPRLRLRALHLDLLLPPPNRHRDVPYAVHAAGLCVARSYMRLTEVGCPVTVAGMSVQPGDIVHGDQHGVLQIPADALPGVFEKAELIRQDEQKLVGWSGSADFSIPKLLELRRVRH